MRVLFDTNIFISVFIIRESLDEKALLRTIEGEDSLLISRDIIDEVLSVYIFSFLISLFALKFLALFLQYTHLFRIN